MVPRLLHLSTINAIESNPSPAGATKYCGIAILICWTLRLRRSISEAAIAGLKAAAVTAVCTAIPTFASVRMSKWAKANLGNPVAKTVIITYAAGMAYFIAGEKKVVELSRKHSLEAAKARAKSEYTLTKSN
uniref:Early nodulin n=3 Tax=Oryza TaxID=4527 RepID=A0A0E0PTB3_ORYRU